MHVSELKARITWTDVRKDWRFIRSVALWEESITDELSFSKLFRPDKYPTIICVFTDWGGCSGLGVCDQGKPAMSYPGCRAIRPSSCCRDEGTDIMEHEYKKSTLCFILFFPIITSLSSFSTGLPVCGFSQRCQCSWPGLSDCQPPDSNRTQNCSDGGDGGDWPLMIKANVNS